MPHLKFWHCLTIGFSVLMTKFLPQGRIILDIYIVTFALSVVYCFVCIVQCNKKYQARFGNVLILILCFLAAGIGIQMLYLEIRVDFICVANRNLLLYNYCGTAVNQVDKTTQLLNRRCYETEIENMKPSAYVLIFDINKFKQLNDTYGHAEGDRALDLVARQIYKVHGKYGACYRIGGDEFCVIMWKNLDKIKTPNCSFQEMIENMNQNNIKLSGVSLGYVKFSSIGSYLLIWHRCIKTAVNSVRSYFADIIIKICKYFNISADYLLGFSDKKVFNMTDLTDEQYHPLCLPYII